MQFTVVGQVGVDGPHAVNPVELVLKNVLEHVPVLLHVMAGDHAQEQRVKHKRATSMHVPVRSGTFSVAASSDCTVLGPFLHSIRRSFFTIGKAVSCCCSLIIEQISLASIAI